MASTDSGEKVIIAMSLYQHLSAGTVNGYHATVRDMANGKSLAIGAEKLSEVSRANIEKRSINNGFVKTGSLMEKFINRRQ